MRTIARALTALAAAALALAAATAAAAGTHENPHATGACAAPHPLFSSLGLLGASGAARVREPALRLGPSDSEIPGSGPKAQPGFAATIDVWFHVVTDGGPGVGDAVVDAQLTALDLAFAGFHGGADTGFRFRLAGITRTASAAWWAAGPGTPEEAEMKRALRRGGPRALNVYATSGAGYLGWAYFPKLMATHKKLAFLDGVVVDAGSLPGGPYGEAYSLGGTLVHETGHWLGLYHTFEQGCIGHGDRVDDTPPQAVPTGGCPVGQDTCPEPGLDPVRNYMDYSFDSCYEEFTPDQAARMQRQYAHWRA